MNGINLLPWREELRIARDREMMVTAVLIWALCAVLVFATYSYYQVLIGNQNQRNKYLQSEISKLDEKILEIRKLRSQKDNLIARMEVIQNLQRQRTRVVHFFDDIVRKLPDGVYFDSMEKKSGSFGFSGTAQSNARVSNLMDKYDSSNWFTNPDLEVINITPAQGVRLSQFDLKLSEKKSNSSDNNSDIDG